MDNPQLRELLEKLHAELEHTPSMDDESRERLRKLMAEVQAALARSGETPAHQYRSINDQLREAIQHFEVTHPVLTAAMAQVMDTLSGMGI